MFEDSLFESRPTIRTNRSATTAASVALQSVLLGLAVLTPLIYTEALPHNKMFVFDLPLPPRGVPPAARTQEAHQQPSVMRSDANRGPLRLPDRIPTHLTDIPEVAAPDIGQETSANSVVTGTRGPGPSVVPEGLLNSHSAVVPQSQAAPRVTMSRGVTQGHLILRVEPVYPQIAIRARIQGEVVLRAAIGRDGAIQNLSIVSGHPMLAQAALDAVRRWRYQPFLLSGQPVEVDTEVTVRFRLGS